MSKMVNLVDSVYDELEQLKNEIKQHKEKSNQCKKTTFSEVLMVLMNSYKSKMVSGQ